MAGTVVITEEVHGTIKKIKYAWTSDASGDADKTTLGALTGKILGLTTVPDGTDAPTDNYDVVVNDEDTVDVLMGGGANRDTANTEHVLSTSLGAVAYDKLDLVVSNAGNAKKGIVYVWIR